MSNPATEETGPQPVGALEVLARDPSERKKFLKMVGKGVGGAAAASSLAAFIAACGSSSSKSTTATPGTTTSASSPNAGDIAIVNYALTLEYLETEFYKKVIKSGLFTGKVQTLLKTFGAQEQTHVNALKAAAKKLGGTPAPKVNGKFTIDNAKNVAKFAATVENLGAAAYLGQAGNIVNLEILGAALAIHTVEARHAAILNTLNGLSITPDGSFAKPMTMDQVLAVVKPLIA
ncbi:MAG: ferritin-like domain-containing protein [Solirubrobacteraceae bacterium]